MLLYFYNRPRGDTSIFTLDATTSQCLHYEATPGYPPKTVAGIPRNLLMEHPEIEIRNDLIDCSIDICSVEVCITFIFINLLAKHGTVGPIIISG